MLREWLGLASDPEAWTLRCRVVAELENDPARECRLSAPPKPEAAPAWRPARQHLDKTFMMVHIANGFWTVPKWVVEVFKRFAPREDMRSSACLGVPSMCVCVCVREQLLCKPVIKAAALNRKAPGSNRGGNSWRRCSACCHAKGVPQILKPVGRRPQDCLGGDGRASRPEM